MDHNRPVNNRPVNEDVARHLHDAIDRLRRDIAEVEFWADVVAGFAEPVPQYDPGQVSVWLPREQAVALRQRHQPAKRPRPG